jgi:hypothetical protein
VGIGSLDDTGDGCAWAMANVGVTWSLLQVLVFALGADASGCGDGAGDKGVWMVASVGATSLAVECGQRCGLVSLRCVVVRLCGYLASRRVIRSLACLRCGAADRGVAGARAAL